jgi:hypothetical protein
MRAKFFPGVKQTHALNYTEVRDGRVVRQATLLEGGEGASGEIPSAGRFQVTADQRLLVICYVNGRDSDGRSVSENRLLEILPGGKVGSRVRLDLRKPFTSYFTATVRAGSSPSDRLELLGHQEGSPQTISYARIRLRDSTGK